MSDGRRHQFWLREAKERILSRRNRTESYAMCGNCGCKGNMECKHLPLNIKEACTLDPNTDLCPCCEIIHEQASDADYDNEVGQARLC